jgi:CHAD domain-containing protein
MKKDARKHEVMEGDLRYGFPEGATHRLLAAIVADDYALKAEELAEIAVVFYDTFDWRLFKKFLVLCRIGDELIVRGLPTGADLESLTVASPPAFALEIADSPLRQRIAPIAGVRRLLPVGEASIQTTPYRVLNTDGKTVARLLSATVWSGSTRGAALLDAHVVLRPMRGYRAHARRLSQRFAEAGLAASQWQATFEQILTAANMQPGSYSAKPDYHLQPGARADQATKTILRSTLAIMRANEEGIKADWDVEFLHDYRTALRRTRAALSQITGVFPPEITERYKEAFARLGERSNRLRDLDVFLLSEPDVRAMLPADMRTAIDPLFDYVHGQRQQALQEVIDHLNSLPYETMIESWKAFLHEPVPDARTAPNALLPVDDIARRQIGKRYRRVIKDGNRILEDAQDERVHALRIDCKKLRYLMEFFASLFPKKEISSLIGQLRILQDDLGVFNDLSIQQAHLFQIAAVLPANDTQAKKGLVAIGILAERLARDQQEMKPGIARNFTRFSAARNRKLFRKLLRDY